MIGIDFLMHISGLIEKELDDYRPYKKNEGVISNTPIFYGLKLRLPITHQAFSYS
jgi:hypothetical protein